MAVIENYSADTMPGDQQRFGRLVSDLVMSGFKPVTYEVPELINPGGIPPFEIVKASIQRAEFIQSGRNDMLMHSLDLLRTNPATLESDRFEEVRLYLPESLVERGYYEYRDATGKLHQYVHIGPHVDRVTATIKRFSRRLKRIEEVPAELTQDADAL